MKEFRIIKNELPVLLLPVIDDIVTVCASLVNLVDPLCDKDWFLFHRHVIHMKLQKLLIFYSASRPLGVFLIMT